MHEAALQSEKTAALLSWWREAGVDMNVEEEPFSWLSARLGSAEMVNGDAKPASAKSHANKADVPMPDTLSALVEWLKTDPLLPDAGPPDRRFVAAGPANPELMIVTDMPETDDYHSGMLFAGACSPLVEAMLAAIGESRETVYIAPLCPGRTATGQIAKTALPRLTEIMRHHISLVVPKRLWLLGTTVSRAILGMDDVASAGNLHDFNHATVKVPTVASFAPRFLLEHPQQKARVWADMQALIKGI